MSSSSQLPPGTFPGGVHIYGDSLMVGEGAHYFPHGWMHRLAILLGAEAHQRGRSAGQFESGWVTVLQACNATVKSDDALPYRAWPRGERLVGIGFGFNDLFLGGRAAIPPCISAMRGMISRALAGLIMDDRSLTLSATGGPRGWSPVFTRRRNTGNAYWETSVNGAHFGYTTREALPGMVYAVGGPVLAGTTGFIDITLDGTPHGTVDLSESAPLADGRYGLWCHRLRDIPPHGADGAHSIRGTVRDLSADGKVGIDHCCIEAGIPPVVLVKNVVRPLSEDPIWAATREERDEDIRALNAALESLCGEFEKDGIANSVLYLDFDSVINRGEALFKGAVSVTGSPQEDGVHLNGEGYARLTGVAYDALREWRSSFDPVAAARYV